MEKGDGTLRALVYFSLHSLMCLIIVCGFKIRGDLIVMTCKNFQV